MSADVGRTAGELPDPREAWNQGADAWEAFVESGADYYRREVHGLALLGYFDTGPTVCDWSMPRLDYAWKTPYWRYTLSQWTEAIGSVGLTIRAIEEPRPTAEQVSAHPSLEDCSRVPYFLIFVLSRT